MTTTRVHHPLPAPVVHAGFSIPQSKSHVLAGVQDAYWSDDEAEDAECPLCLEEMDISDLNFKPCVCGYQICRFCWHHIKENLNKRCPACRRVYTDEGVEFKPINTEDHKRLTQQKKQRERERKELEALGRRHLANVRVVQRNVVYVVGISPQYAKEELIPTLRSTDYFGQYGKISKMVLVKRTPTGGGTPVVGIYITYHRREDAARAIHAVDGSPSPGGGRELMRASYGTTKYCMAFLRGVSCSDTNCMNLHQWGDEKDCFTKEDLTTLKHTIKTSESKPRGRKGEENDILPRSAAWGSKTSTVASSSATSRQTRRGATNGITRDRERQPRNTTERTTGSKSNHDRKPSTTKTPSQASNSRPSTPSTTSLPPRPASPADVKTSRKKKEQQKAQRPQSPEPEPITETEDEAALQQVAESKPAESVVPSVPPGLPAPPPGLSAPPGLPGPRPPRVDSASPQTPLLAYHSTYQVSNAALALIDDVKARRGQQPTAAAQSPFPDLDRTLQSLTSDDGGIGFSWDIDPRLIVDEVAMSGDESGPHVVDLERETPASVPYTSFHAGFPALVNGSYAGPPGLIPHHSSSRVLYDANDPFRSSPIEPQSTGGSAKYTFDPFDEPSSSRRASVIDEDSTRKMSRFGFARGRQGSTTSSPMHIPSPLSISSSNLESTHSLYNNSFTNSTNSPIHPHWSTHDYQASPMANSPLTQVQQPIPQYIQQTRYQSFEAGVSEAQLRELIQSSRGRNSPNVAPHVIDSQESYQSSINQQFTDPAIMSARIATRPESNVASHYGPPPGLSFPATGPMNHPHQPYAMPNVLTAELASPTETPALPTLSTVDFPALTASETTPVKEEATSPPSEMSLDAKAREKAERKAAKKAAAAEKAAERTRIAQEKAVQKAAEKAKLAAEKAEKEKAAAELKAQQEKERLENERLQKEKEKAAKAERERLAQVEREKAEKERLEREKVEKVKAAEKAAKKAAAAKVAEAQKNKSVPAPATASVTTPSSEAEPPIQFLSKKPKKNKPVAKPVKVAHHKEEDHLLDEASSIPSASASVSDAHLPLKGQSTESSTRNNSRATSVERLSGPFTIGDFLHEIHIANPSMHIPNHSFFDLHKINPAAKMPLEYGPLVHALSALSVGGGSFANNVPSGSIDNAVSSFQQLLETLTQTISDLLRLLPRTTWDDSSSFDGVLRDMLKGDDFLDDNAEEGAGKEDEVAALTLALERRARWMEVQLSKLEELHRDINTAAVKAVLSFNDNGWDRSGSLPRVGNTLKRFETLGSVSEDGTMRSMNSDELEKKFAVAEEVAGFAETELREMMEKMQVFKPVEEEV